ncbi:MAG: response regulator [Proteobacteria bacterium]|nr:response regulator [Pseudomonadota bacterium]
MTTSPRILIVEDEPLLRHQLRDTLTELWPELSVIDEADCGIAAISRINEALPDIAFLDIHLPDMSGIEIARLLRGRCQVVFVTAYDDYAVKAFEQEALDYVLKPATVARLSDTVARLKSRQTQAVRPNMDQLLAQLAQRMSPKSDGYLR